MSEISKRLEHFVTSTQKKLNLVMPIKTEEGILVGDVLIRSEDNFKHLEQRGLLVYDYIFLNTVAIKLANVLAKHGDMGYCDKLYKLDQEYGKWYVDSQQLRARYQQALNNNNEEKASLFYARYDQSRERMMTAKKRASELAGIE
jgi:hypothetical protein